jgi:hypothetical protein
MAKVVIDIAAEYTGNKAFKQAETASQKLEKSVAKLGKQLLGVFAATKLISFGKTAAKAFAADEKAARSLSLALANTGNAFRGIEVETFIADLQRATGVLDDNLRPAFRTLLTATGDVTKSQEGLKLALDIAAGTGKDLGSVSMALSKAYGGQTTALSRLGAGLSKATLKTGNMDEIIAELTAKFKGQALTAAQGYSGQMDILTVASNNAKEIIGKGLLDAMSLVAGDQGIGGAAKSMENFATQTSDAIYGIGVLTAKLKSLPGAGFISNFLSAATQVSGFALLSKFGKSQRATPAQSPGERKQIDKINKDALKFQKQQNDLAKIDIANTTRKLVLTADQQALEELKKKFDVERIGLFSALNQATDEETRMRLKSLIAIYDNDAALALKIKKELEAAEAARLLALALTASLTAWGNWQTLIGNSFAAAALAAVPPAQIATPSMPSPSYAPGDIPGISGQRGFRFAGADSSSPTIVVNVAGSVTAERDLVSAITQGIYNNQASGIPISYSTSYV